MKLRFFEARRYFHGASKPGEEYLVDLDENGGAGKCSCPDFEFRIQPEIDAGRPGRDCRHLRTIRTVDDYAKALHVKESELCEMINKIMA